MSGGYRAKEPMVTPSEVGVERLVGQEVRKRLKDRDQGTGENHTSAVSEGP